MIPQPPTPSDSLEQAHLLLLQGHLGQARSVLERLVIAEPDNEAAQDLRAIVVARQAVITETLRLQSGGCPSVAAPTQAGSFLNRALPVGWVWNRPVAWSGSVLLHTPSARRWPTPIRLLVRLLPAALFVLLAAARFWPSSQDVRDAQVARGLVEAAYQSAHAGAMDDLPVRYRWAAIDRDYGPVSAWRIRGSRRDLLSGEWLFDVDVTRARAVTREQVDAWAGPSRSYGYSSSIHDVTVESSRPLPPR